MKNTLLNIVSFFALGLMISSADAGETCGCDVPGAVVGQYDQGLLDVEAFAAIQTHAPWGTPVDITFDAGTRPLYQRHWITGYDPELRLPVWVSYRLQARDLAQPRRRTQCFRPDFRLIRARDATRCLSYRGSGFDRGHMVPSADMTRSEQAMVNTYIFSNIAPQHANFNRGIWRVLESRVRDMARRQGSIFVMSGAIFDHNGDGVRDPDSIAPQARSHKHAPRAAIASHFYKVVAYQTGRQLNITAWLLKHDNSPSAGADGAQALRRREVPLVKIERMSGLDIFPLLPGGAEQALVR